MREVCVITGGGSGMGLAAAKYMPKEKIIVISGRTERKLEKAKAELEELGYTVQGNPGGVSESGADRNGYGKPGERRRRRIDTVYG